jgi:uncharacterized membrane protein
MVYKDADDSVAIRPATGRFPERSLWGTYGDLIALTGLSILTLAVVLTPYFEHSILRFALGIIFVLFVPGYVFIATIYPGKDDLGDLERFLLSAIFSIVLVPLLGYLFNYSIWGIRLDTMVFTTTLIIAVGSLAALVRRHRLPAAKRFTVDIQGPVRDISQFLLPDSKNRADRLVSIGLACAILLSILATAYAVTAPRSDEKYTEFYLCGPTGNMSNYPMFFYLGDTKPMSAVISNHEGTDKTYNLIVTMDGLGNERRQVYSDSFSLADNQTVAKVINLRPDQANTHMNVEFLLYMDNSTAQPYRTCNMWVNVTAPPTEADSLSNEFLNDSLSNVQNGSLSNAHLNTTKT